MDQNNLNIDAMLRQMQAMPEILEKFNRVGEYIAHLEQGLTNLAMENYGIKLTYGLLFDILVEAEIIDKEYLNEQIEEKINVPMKEYIKEIQNKIQENAKQYKEKLEEEQHKFQETEEEEEEAEEENNSSNSVVLASERFKQNKED